MKLYILKLCLISFFLFLRFISYGQQKLSDGSLSNTYAINNDALLELESKTKGLLHARIALEASKSATPFSSHIAGMMIYNTATIADLVPGIYYNDGSQWILASAGQKVDLQYNSSLYQLSFIDKNGDQQLVDLKDIIEKLSFKYLLTNNGDGSYTYITPDGPVLIEITKNVINHFDKIIDDTQVQSLLNNFINNRIGNVLFDGNTFTYVDQAKNIQQLTVQDLVQNNQIITHINGIGPVGVIKTVNSNNPNQIDYAISVDFSAINPIITINNNVLDIAAEFLKNNIDISYSPEVSIIANANQSNIIIQLPSAKVNKAKKIIVKKSDNSSHQVIVKSISSEYIEGISEISGFTPHQGWVFQSTGDNWVIVSRI